MKLRSIFPVLFPVLLCLFSLWAQDRPKNSPELTSEQELHVLRAIHEVDDIEQRKKDLVIKFDQLNQQILDLKSQYQALDPVGKAAQTSLDGVIMGIAREKGIDQTKFTFDQKLLKFVPKEDSAKPAVPTTPPPVPPPAPAPAKTPPAPSK